MNSSDDSSPVNADDHYFYHTVDLPGLGEAQLMYTIVARRTVPMKQA